jgi:hypothetical protein
MVTKGRQSECHDEEALVYLETLLFILLQQ